MKNNKVSYIDIEVIVIVSEPWDFAENVQEGKIIADNGENTAVVVQLEKPIDFMNKRFRKLVCETRHVGQKFDLSDSCKHSNSCAIVGVPDKAFDPNFPFKYDTYTTAYMIGGIWTRKSGLTYLENFERL